MASLLEAIDIKRKMFFEFRRRSLPLSRRDVEPTARGGQTLVRLKMRNLITGRLRQDLKAGDKFKEPDLETVPATSSRLTAAAITSWIRRASTR